MVEVVVVVAVGMYLSSIIAFAMVDVFLYKLKMSMLPVTYRIT